MIDIICLLCLCCFWMSNFRIVFFLQIQDCTCAECLTALQWCPSLNLGGTTWQTHLSHSNLGLPEKQPKNRVALATDEMRGYPDNNTTGIHLVKPHCPFSDTCRQHYTEKGEVSHDPTPLFLYIYMYFFLLYHHIYWIDPNPGGSGWAAGSPIFTPILFFLFFCVYVGEKTTKPTRSVQNSHFFLSLQSYTHTHTTPPVCGHFEHCKQT